MTVVQLRELARANKVRLPYGVNKAQMVETLFRQLGSGMKPAQAPAEQADIGLYKPKPLGFYDEEYGTSNPVVPQMLKAGLLGSGHGLLEVQPGGYGFLRAQNGTPGADDIYVSIAQIRRFNLHSGDEIVGKTRPKRMGDRYNALMYIESVNGENPEIARVRRPFDSLTPIHPNRRLTLEGEGEPGDPSMRLMDFIAPIGLGQRALIVAPPKAGLFSFAQGLALALLTLSSWSLNVHLFPLYDTQLSFIRELCTLANGAALVPVAVGASSACVAQAGAHGHCDLRSCGRVAARVGG